MAQLDAKAADKLMQNTQGVPTPVQAYPVQQANAGNKPNSNTGAVLAVIVLIIVIVAVAVGILVANGGGDDEVIEIDPDNYVQLEFLTGANAAARNAFASAANRWGEIISENQLQATVFPAGEDLCLVGNSDNADLVLEQLLIFAIIQDLDGAGGILGLAFPCNLDASGRFPIVGLMAFDSADLAVLQREGTLEAVILHEMGHVLGIGTFWQSAVQGEIREDPPPVEDRLLQDPVLDLSGPNPVVIDPNNQPKFVGLAARDELGKITGNNEPFVAVENGVDNGREIFPSREDGAGSIDGHWDNDFLPGELMVFAIDVTGGQPPLSAVSIASLQDLGYTVDITQADAFDLARQNLRGEDATERKVINLENDIPSWYDPTKLKRGLPAN